MNSQELKMLQALPLELKVLKTQARIFDAIRHFGIDGIYISYSGGKDSTVLHHVSLELEKKLYGKMVIPRVFSDTGLEYPEVRKMVYDLREQYGDLVQIIKPNMPFVKVIQKYGYPLISKEQSQFIYQYRTAKSQKTKDTRWNGNKWGAGKISEKWKYLVETDIPISDNCCNIMKKIPFKKYEKQTNRIPILGKMACESQIRKQGYLKQGGCNAFDNKRPKSEPIGFWTEQDVLLYIMQNEEVKIASVYGDIVETEEGKLKTSKCDRTGCVWCPYGVTSEKGENRFQRLERTHPQLHDYCMRGGKLNEEGKWIPDKGLGMAHVLETINIKWKNEETDE